MDFSDLFHQSSKDRTGGGTVRVPHDESLWPPEWRTVSYKSYPRFKKISLPEAKPTGEFAELIDRRRSGRSFSGKPVTIDALSAILKYSCGIIGDNAGRKIRAQPSGGSRYPIEVYPLVFAGSETVPAGLYHYGVKDHALDVLWQRPFSKADIGSLFTYDWAQDASVAFVMTAIFDRTKRKYGERGYRYALLEAGHIGQNVYLNAAASGIKCVAIDGIHDEAIEKLIDIDGTTESVLYALCVGT